MKACNKIYILSQSLSKYVTELDLESGRIYPPQRQIREVSIKIATDISEWLYNNGQATTYPEPIDKDVYIRKQLYDTTYDNFEPNQWSWPEELTNPRSDW